MRVEVVVASYAAARFDAQAASVPYAAFRFLCISHGTLCCYLSDTSGGPARRSSRPEPEHKEIDAFLVSCHLEWGSQATVLPTRPPTHPPIHPPSCQVRRRVGREGERAGGGGWKLLLKVQWLDLGQRLIREACFDAQAALVPHGKVCGGTRGRCAVAVRRSRRRFTSYVFHMVP